MKSVLFIPFYLVLCCLWCNSALATTYYFHTLSDINDQDNWLGLEDSEKTDLLTTGTIEILDDSDPLCIDINWDFEIFGKDTYSFRSGPSSVLYAPGDPEGGYYSSFNSSIDHLFTGAYSDKELVALFFRGPIEVGVYVGPTILAQWVFEYSPDVEFNLDSFYLSAPPCPAPEPSAILLFGSGLVALSGMCRRRNNR